MDAEPLPHLETFARAAELSSFTAAARALGLTQAAVSQRVGALERRLGVALFRREGGHVLLTDAGIRLYDYAQRILELYRAAVRDVAGRHAPLTGELKLSASSVPGEHLLPELLAAYRARYPHVQVRALVSDSREVLNQVEQGEVHLGLVGGRADNPHLEFRGIGCDRLVVIVPTGHAWARRRHVSLTQLAAQPLILREPGSGSRWCLEEALAAAGTTLGAMRIALELGSNEAIKEAVARGLGVAVMSGQAVQKELAAGALHAVGVTGLALEREMFVVRDRRRVLPIPGRLFLDLLDVAGQAP
jgi:DNA-binding transcriptional LysR family regulator